MHWNHYEEKKTQSSTCLNSKDQLTDFSTFLFSCAPQHRILSFPLMNFLLSCRQTSGSTIHCGNWNLLLGEVLQYLHCLEWSLPLGFNVWCTLLDLRQRRWIYYRSCIRSQKTCPCLTFWSLWYSWSCSRVGIKSFLFLETGANCSWNKYREVNCHTEKITALFFLHIS